jgi:hypothetical protein
VNSKEVTKGKKKELFNYSELARQARRGEFGNLKLLALSIGVTLLCLFLLLYVRGKAASSTESLAAGAESGEVSVAPADGEQAAEDALSSDVVVPDPLGLSSPESKARDGVQSSQLSPEEMKQRFREMADQMPPGQVIIF